MDGKKWDALFKAWADAQSGDASRGGMTKLPYYDPKSGGRFQTLEELEAARDMRNEPNTLLKLLQDMERRSRR